MRLGRRCVPERATAGRALSTSEYHTVSRAHSMLVDLIMFLRPRRDTVDRKKRRRRLLNVFYAAATLLRALLPAACLLEVCVFTIPYVSVPYSQSPSPD